MKRNMKIGTERESSLHRSLKLRYSGPGGATEILVEGYICDARTGAGEYVEIQLGSFAPLREKVQALGGAVRIVHPIIALKHIELYDTEGTLLSRRKSPHKGSPWDLFHVLRWAPELPLCPGLTIELAEVEVVEKRVKDGKGSWRRKGVSVVDKTLAAWRSSVSLASREDYRRFVPLAPGIPFTARHLAETTGITPPLARQCLYVLSHLGLVTKTGKQGRSFLYQTQP